ncbi:methyl-accepting chemotaxis protein [Paenibacillus albus]|uniref:Methyl-accepting chemotaxis protein n=1 Tax=Paenibacillus albus TaxID=2495582 RepID=A0A3S9A0G7_9BACL|nr:methyl-accepting chemotaxis protein [Paenibacillus albus]AZN39221.1 methyl-accepting chemotaxis protein [Paenibacillus albus]
MNRLSLLQRLTPRKLTAKLMISTLVISLLIVVSMSLALFIPNSSVFRNQINEKLALQTQTIAAQLDEDILQKLAKVESLANIGALNGMDMQKHQALITSFAKQNPDLIGAAFSVDPTGKVGYNNTGAQVDYSATPILKQVFQGVPSIGNPTAPKIDPTKLIVPLVYPLMKDGQAFGFYAAGYDINEATKIVKEAKIGDTGYAVMLGSNGLMVYHPDPALQMMKTVYDLNVPEVVASYESAEVGKNTSYTYTFKGVKKIGYAAKTKSGFVIQMAVPERELLGPIYTMMTTTIVAAVIVLLAALVLVYFSAKALAKPILYISQMVNVFAGGDLRPRLKVNSKDELGILADHINEMVDSLSSTIEQVTSASESVAASAQQITASTDEVARGSVSQADRSRTMAHVFESLESSILLVASSAHSARALSQEAVEIAREGTETISLSIDKMERANTQMELLESDSKKIGEIIEVIDGIAEQTNLLALNAAIEAARAGEQGRGFAVVADEVRKLAERSSEATKQIGSIIKNMQDNAARSVHAVGEGVAQFAQTQHSFDGIVTKVNDTYQMVGEITASSENQTKRASEMLVEIESVAAISEQAAASAEETAAASHELATLAEKLQGSVDTFKY